MIGLLSVALILHNYVPEEEACKYLSFSSVFKTSNMHPKEK